MSKVLLLTASFGDGHNQAAFALRESLLSSGAEVKLVDYVEWLHPAVRSFAKFSLIQGVQRAPSLYGLFYKSMSRIEPTSPLQRQLNHIGMSQMKQCLRSFDPDVVVSTFPTPTGVVSELRALGHTRVPNVAVVTDYTAHRQWIHTYTDRYFVATETVKSELVRNRVASHLISVTGIPIRKQFNPDHVAILLAKRLTLRAEQGFLEDAPLVLIMGGGSGVLGNVGDWEELLRSSPLQFAVICGHNERLYRRFEPLASNRIKVVRYTSEIGQWMAMADLIVTKPGGLTLTEAMAMALPVMVYRPIPGQETQNARYALSTGAATLVEDVQSAAAFFKNIAENPTILGNMRRAAAQHVVSSAADVITSEILTLAGQYVKFRSATSEKSMPSVYSL